MNEIELQKLVEDISLRYFRVPFVHQATFNKRLKTTGGRYLLRSHAIELNPIYYERFGKEDLTGIIKHELCHYHLHLAGRGYQHRDEDFRKLLKAVNAPRFCKVIEESKKRPSMLVYRYECTACRQSYDRKRKMNIEKYVCGKCRGRLKVVSKNGKEIDMAMEI